MPPTDRQLRALKLLVAVGMAAVALAGLDRPADFDEVNFLALARGAALDPWRPHSISINWQGTTERAFDVLSNPPGIAWWLAPVASAGPLVQRLWMLPWLGLAAWGAGQLGRRFLASRLLGAAVLLASPIACLSWTSLLPDSPLYACTLAGVGGFAMARSSRSGAAFALVTGCAALFRYSGAVLVPVLLAYAFLFRRPIWTTFPTVLPLTLLAAHDLQAYGSIHLFAMGKFQSIANSPSEIAHKLVASACMLGGAAALPVFRWDRRALVAAAAMALAASPWGWTAAAFGALGGAALQAPILGLLRTSRDAKAGDAGDDPAAQRPSQVVFLIWAALGLGFLLSLRFAATRYWLPFLPAVILAFGTNGALWRTAASLLLGLGLTLDAREQARADAALAEEAVAAAEASPAPVADRRFVGHWGWQGVLEAHGWKPLEEGEVPARGALVAIPSQAWPQATGAACNAVVWCGAANPRFPWLPRGYSAGATANLHASSIAGPQPVSTVAPWSFATDAYESARICHE